jgi:hypothetical protein
MMRMGQHIKGLDPGHPVHFSELLQVKSQGYRITAQVNDFFRSG